MFLKVDNKHINIKKITWYEANPEHSKRVKIIFDNGLSQNLEFDKQDDLKAFIEAIDKANS
ncbi:MULTISPECIES: hypothetical protein [Acinetobacter calcoaceticus/baumannii complex]|uniref:hypothetical protein n=1 Tax=Acinetobacter calcoaceticus/baumannii complex TaxID=909768 RepID=UPI000E75A7D0|nr:hypothetical protein [Acinetobacter baumannii]MBI1415406.1 hypothetical protein [Acinetobacter baumannii]MBI1429429.1 hypothetical protein [Acinetobacter baumannii]MDC5465884.1 hypothetical protein [Acinetobacter baumannii]QLI35591.1 hypothetical protein HLG75_05970 [Acinetobacter baumannii]RJN66140.1 hypothetical protein D3X67_18185 [Acinetobacter baumannii]